MMLLASLLLNLTAGVVSLYAQALLMAALHALVGRSAGLNPSIVFIGLGKPLKKVHFRDLYVFILQYPFAGFVLFARPLRRERLVNLAYVGSIVPIEIGRFTALVAATQMLPVSGLSIATLVPGIFLSACGIASKLTDRPASFITPYTGPGLGTWWRIIWQNADISQHTRAAFERVIGAYGQPGQVFPEWTWQLEKVAQHLANFDLSDKRTTETLERDLSTPLPVIFELHILDRLITNLGFRDGAEWLGKADQWSARALELAPDHPAIMSSRGGVLIELGRFEEGISLLERVEGGDAYNRSINAAARASALYRMGHCEDGANLFRTAVRTLAESEPERPSPERLLAYFGQRTGFSNAEFIAMTAEAAQMAKAVRSAEATFDHAAPPVWLTRT